MFFFLILIIVIIIIIIIIIIIFCYTINCITTTSHELFTLCAGRPADVLSIVIQGDRHHITFVQSIINHRCYS